MRVTKPMSLHLTRLRLTRLRLTPSRLWEMLGSELGEDQVRVLAGHLEMDVREIEEHESPTTPTSGST
jgi:hypothetical protein